MIAAPETGSRRRAVSPTSGAVRVLRVAMLGGSSMTLAAVAHVTGGGSMPSLKALCAMALVVGLVAVSITARECRPTVLLGVLGLEQLFLHYTMAALTSRADCMVASAGPALHAGTDAVVCHTGLAAAHAGAGLSQPMSLQMWSGHVVATVLTAWLLSRGEASLWRLAERIVSAAGAVAGPWPAGQPRLLPVAPLVAAHATPTRDDATPRGPPVRALA